MQSTINSDTIICGQIYSIDSGVISIVFGWPKIILIWEECFCLQVNQLGFFLKWEQIHTM